MTKVPLEAQYVAVLVTQQRPVHSSGFLPRSASRAR
jgi:hypothetical protein